MQRNSLQVDVDGHFKYSPVIEINGLPNQGFALEQNVPNPVKTTTTISYTLAERSTLVITLYDVTGRAVMVIERSLKEAGNYRVTIDCSDLRPGIYYYEMAFAKRKLSKKMMVIK